MTLENAIHSLGGRENFCTGDFLAKLTLGSDQRDCVSPTKTGGAGVLEIFTVCP